MNLIILAIVLGIVVIAYLGIFVMQRATVKKVTTFKDRKAQLMSLKVRAAYLLQISMESSPLLLPHA